jgi:hypothetical protein
MWLYKLFLFSLCYICFSFNISAQKNTYSLADLSFLSGQWRGEAFGGTVEEVWSEPSTNAMMGMFRLQFDGIDKLYEFLLIEKTDEDIQMRFKHIRRGYKEMEDEPIILVLKNVSESFAEFASEDSLLIIKYNLVSADSLVVELTSIKQGYAEVTPITMNRKIK